MNIGFTSNDLFEDLTLSDLENRTDSSSGNDFGNLNERGHADQVLSSSVEQALSPNFIRH